MGFCSNCGREIPDYMQFCPGCGAQNLYYNSESANVETPTIENNLKQPYTTVQYQPGYELSEENHPKKKSNKLVLICTLIIVFVIACGVVVIKYFTSDNYNYKKAQKLLSSGQYELAFNIFSSLGDYEDSASMLPFHGTYTNASDEYSRELLFKKGKYSIKYTDSDGDKDEYGTVESDMWSSATLTNGDESGKNVFKAYKNYIYLAEDEDYYYDEKVDISDGLFNGTVSESKVVTTNFTYIDYECYTFQEDGTYTYKGSITPDGEGTPIVEYEDSGTYEIDGDLVILVSNEEEIQRIFLVVDNFMYSELYVRDY